MSVVTFSLLLFIVISYNQALAIKCYQCSSFLDERCGTTWGFTGREADMYLEECPETSLACKKLQFEELLTGHMMVTRSCFNTSATILEYIPKDCKEMSAGESCYCVPKDDQTPCNGQEAIVIPHLLQWLIMVVICLAFVL